LLHTRLLMHCFSLNLWFMLYLGICSMNNFRSSASSGKRPSSVSSKIYGWFSPGGGTHILSGSPCDRRRM
jgi:hypothetical protein